MEQQSEQKIELVGKNNFKIIQDQFNYRFSLDSILLAEFIKLKYKEKMMDLGTGCGIIPMMVYDPDKECTIYGVEIQDCLADIARKNVSLNHLEDKMIMIREDMRNLPKGFKAESFDVVTANPPYITKGRGKQSERGEQLLARHEINVTMEDLVSIGYYLLKKRGRFYLIHRADCLVPVMMVLKKYLLEPKLLQFVYTRKDGLAKRFLLEARKEGGTELKVLQPIFLKR
ncbi:MAG: methyltransferase [Candidatus Atribacteria bacterium]|nr:methyltransferase [Candidatus Atribacteria bacterium]